MFHSLGALELHQRARTKTCAILEVQWNNTSAHQYGEWIFSVFFVCLSRRWPELSFSCVHYGWWWRQLMFPMSYHVESASICFKGPSWPPNWPAESPQYLDLNPQSHSFYEQQSLPSFYGRSPYSKIHTSPSDLIMQQCRYYTLNRVGDLSSCMFADGVCRCFLCVSCLTVLIVQLYIPWWNHLQLVFCFKARLIKELITGIRWRALWLNQESVLSLWTLR